MGDHMLSSTCCQNQKKCPWDSFLLDPFFPFPEMASFWKGFQTHLENTSLVAFRVCQWRQFSFLPPNAKMGASLICPSYYMYQASMDYTHNTRAICVSRKSSKPNSQRFFLGRLWVGSLTVARDSTAKIPRLLPEFGGLKIWSMENLGVT